MKKVAILVVALLLSSFSASAASIHSGQFAVGLHMAWWDPKDADEDTVFFGLQSRIRLSDSFAIEGAIDYYSEEIGTDIDFILYPVQVSLLAYVINTRIIEAYLAAGAGWFNWKYESPYGDKSGDEFSYHGGVGVELPLARHFSVHADMRWVFFKPEVDSEYDDWSGIWTNLGFSIYF